MTDTEDNQSVVSVHRWTAEDLAYNSMTVDPSGSILSRATKLSERQRLGYCLTCTERPILLYAVRKSRFNPWQSKQARSVPGECENGVCLRCRNKEQQPPTTRTSHPPPPQRGARVAPAVATSTHRTTSNSTLSTDLFTASRTSGSVATDSLSQPRGTPHTRGTTSHHSAEGWGRHSYHRSNLPQQPRRTLSNESMTGLHAVTHHGATTTVSAYTASTGTQSGTGTSHPTPNNNGTPRITRRTRELRGAPMTVNKPTLTQSEHMPVPTLIANRPVARQSSNSNFSVASSVSYDSILSKGEEAADANHNTTPSLREDTAQHDDVALLPHQMTTFFHDSGASPVDMAHALNTTIKEKMAHESVQVYCLQSALPLPVSVVMESELYRGALMAMKNHRGSLQVQQLCLQLLVPWCEDDDLRRVLIARGVCDQVRPLLALHVGDAVVVEHVLALLRLVTLDDDGRRDCQYVTDSIVHGMQCHEQHARIQTDGCAVLSNLSIDVHAKTVAVVSPAVLDAVTAALISQATETGLIEWTVVKSACFTIKNFLYQEENQRELASRDDVLQALETLLQKGPRRSKDAVAVLEKLQLARVQDESLQAQVLEALQLIWNKPVPQAMEEILHVWQEHASRPRILIVSLHQMQDMLATHEYTEYDLLERIHDASRTLEDHRDKRVVEEVQRLQAQLMGD